MKKIYWFFWWLYNCPEIVWLKIKEITMDWIDVEQELPPPKTKVKLSYGLLRTGAAVCDDWVSEGWLLESGTWSVKLVEGMPKWPEPTHWKYLENE